MVMGDGGTAEILEKFRTLQSRAKHLQSQVDRSKVEYDVALSELRDKWGVTGVKGAKALADKKTKQLKKAQQELSESLGLLEEVLDGFEGG